MRDIVLQTFDESDITVLTDIMTRAPYVRGSLICAVEDPDNRKACGRRTPHPPWRDNLDIERKAFYVKGKAFWRVHFSVVCISPR